MSTVTKHLLDTIWHIDQAIGSLSILQSRVDMNLALTSSQRSKLVNIFYKAQLQLEKQARRLENKAIRRRLL